MSDMIDILEAKIAILEDEQECFPTDRLEAELDSAYDLLATVVERTYRPSNARGMDVAPEWNVEWNDGGIPVECGWHNN